LTVIVCVEKNKKWKDVPLVSVSTIFIKYIELLNPYPDVLSHIP
jgi:hypothetical protein